MSPELLISLISTLVAVASTAFGIFSYRFNRSTYQLAQTPIMLPDPMPENGAIVIRNKHESGVAKDFHCSLTTKSGKVFRTNDDEFLPPGWASRMHNVGAEDLTNAVFRCHYKNIFDQKVTIKGVFKLDYGGMLEIRNVDMKISSIN
ncbi:MAG: hypothetical protein RI911_172 [Candidatus Parcubacteria bacterium]